MSEFPSVSNFGPLPAVAPEICQLLTELVVVTKSNILNWLVPRIEETPLRVLVFIVKESLLIMYVAGVAAAMKK